MNAIQPSVAPPEQLAASLSGLAEGHTEALVCARIAALRADTMVISSSLAPPVRRPFRAKSRNAGTPIPRSTAARASTIMSSNNVNPRDERFMGADAALECRGRGAVPTSGSPGGMSGARV
jgi:hypothetical protein